MRTWRLSEGTEAARAERAACEAGDDFAALCPSQFT